MSDTDDHHERTPRHWFEWWMIHGGATASLFVSAGALIAIFAGVNPRTAMFATMPVVGAWIGSWVLWFGWTILARTARAAP